MGQYIPALKKWLEQGLWSVEPPPRSGPIWGASGELGEIELDAIRRLLAEDDGTEFHPGKQEDGSS